MKFDDYFPARTKGSTRFTQRTDRASRTFVDPVFGLLFRPCASLKSHIVQIPTDKLCRTDQDPIRETHCIYILDMIRHTPHMRTVSAWEALDGSWHGGI